MRAFVAIDLPEEARVAIHRLQAMLPAGRPVPPERLHLTLAFLDDQPEDLLEEFHYALDALRAARFEVTFDGLGEFGGRRPRLVFARVRAGQALTGLRQSVLRAARQVWIDVRHGRFHPHVTLARLPRHADLADIARIQAFLARHARDPLPGFAVSRFALYCSTLHPDGARHEELAAYPLI